MGVLDFGGDCWRGRGSLGVNLRRPIETNGDFVASLCGSVYSDWAVVLRGEWGWLRHSCVRCLKEKGLFLAWFRKHARNSPILFNGERTYWSMIDLCVESWQYFPTQITSLNSVSNWLSYDIVRFKIEVGVEEKFMYKNVTQHRQDCCRSVATAKLHRHFTMT